MSEWPRMPLELIPRCLDSTRQQMATQEQNSRMEETVEKPASLVARGTNAISLACVLSTSASTSEALLTLNPIAHSVKHRALVATAATTTLKYYTVGRKLVSTAPQRALADLAELQPCKKAGTSPHR